MGLLSRMGRAATELSKYYYPFTWRNKPSIESPINEVHLNHIEDGINEMDNRILILAQDKADATDIANVFVDFAMDDSTGIMTFTRFDGSKVTHDSAVEKIALNCYLEGDNFVLELADGTKQKVSLSKFIDTYTFSSTDTIRMTVNGKNVSAEIPDGKITLAKLEPTIMSTIRQYTLDAQTAQGVAEQAAGTAQGWAIGGTGFEDNNAKHYASRSQRYAVGGVEEGDTKDNAKYYCQKAQAAAEQAAGSAAYDGTATSVKATDTQGLVVSAGGDSNTQVLLDVLARKVAQELVSDSGLATKLADYVKKTDIVQTESTATDKVPSSAYLKQALGTINSNLANGYPSSICVKDELENSLIKIQGFADGNAGISLNNANGTIHRLFFNSDGRLRYGKYNNTWSVSDILTNADYKAKTITNSYGLSVVLFTFGNDTIKAIKIGGYVNKALSAGTAYTIAANAEAKSRVEWYHNIHCGINGVNTVAYLRITTDGNIVLTPQTAIASGVGLNIAEYYV